MGRKVVINGRWPLVLPDSSADEWEGNMKYHANTWEMPRLLALEALVKSKKDPIVLYIGAYKGDMAALLASWGAHLILVESTPAFWGIIKETWDLNPELPKPIACFSGLISRIDANASDGSMAFMGEFPARTAEYIEGAVGFTHLAESKDDVTFPQFSIDQICKIAGTPDIITIDIEGSELEAAYGGLSMIVDNKPAWLLSVHPEFMYHNHGTYERELHDLFRNNKFTGTWLDYDHEHHWLYEATK
jgi:FkbM family methyltransferase